MSDPFSGTGLAGLALTGASVYGLLTGTDYGVVFGAFAGAVFYIATAADLSVLRRLAYFFDAPRDKCAHFREINGIAAAFQYLQKNYNPTASSFL